MKLYSISFFGLVLAVGPVWLSAQEKERAPTPVPEVVLRQFAAKDDIVNTFRAGDMLQAFAKLRAFVDHSGRSGSENCQVIVQAASIARMLNAENMSLGRAVATATIAEASKVRLSVSQAECAVIDAKTGDLYEWVFGDSVKANELYQSALARDGGRADAKEGIQRFERLKKSIEDSEQAAEAARRQRQ